jgi:hypothetical protein
MTEERRERNDGENGQDEEQGVRFRAEALAEEDGGNEHQKPE